MFGRLWPFLVPLAFLAPYLADGLRRIGGCLKRSASIITKGRGTRTPGTGTTAGCSFFYRRGEASAGTLGPILLPLVNSSTARGASTFATGTRGASGGRQDGADSDD